jgi:hypothetical protein
VDLCRSEHFNLALSEAASLATQSLVDLSSYIKSLQASPIDTLPIEILAHIFDFLDIPDLATCTKTCQRWKQVTSTNSQIWRKPIVLRGLLIRAEIKWKAFCKVSGGQTPHLTLNLSRDEGQDMFKIWESSTLRTTFPSKSLTHFEYSGQDLHMDEQIWTCVKSCSKLKVFRWKSVMHDRDEDWYVDRQVRGTPLANCRLEEVRMEDPTPAIVDQEFSVMLSQVKRLYLLMYMLSPRLWQVLMAVRHTVQELHITGTCNNDNRIDGNITRSDHQQEASAIARRIPIEMKQVTSFSTLWDDERDATYIQPPLRHLLALPQVAKAILRGDVVKWVDIANFQENLTHFECHINQLSDVNEVDLNLFFLPNCESLILTCKCQAAMTRFWRAMQEEEEVLRILPRLKHLKIAGDSLSFEIADIISFVKFKSSIGYPMETLHIYKSSRLDHESLIWLRSAVPDFLYSQSNLGRLFLPEE